MKQILLFITLAFFASCAKDEELSTKDAAAPTETIYIRSVGYGNTDITLMPTIDGAYKIEQGGVTIMPTERMYFKQHLTDLRVPAVETTFICGSQSADGFTQFTDTFVVNLSGASGELFVEKGGRNLSIFVE